MGNICVGFTCVSFELKSDSRTCQTGTKDVEEWESYSEEEPDFSAAKKEAHWPSKDKPMFNFPSSAMQKKDAQGEAPKKKKAKAQQGQASLMSFFGKK
jgi:hypothetical protein